LIDNANDCNQLANFRQVTAETDGQLLVGIALVDTTFLKFFLAADVEKPLGGMGLTHHAVNLKKCFIWFFLPE